MILNLLLEEIENQKLNKFYTQFYATKLAEDDFLKIVGLDLSSYQGNNFNNPLVGVGQLASAIFLPDYVGSGKSYIDGNLENIKRASQEFITNRNSFEIKNPKQFTSTEQFTKYILDGVKPEGAVSAPLKPAKKELTADEKLEQLRAQQMPNIPDLNIFKEICLLDIDNNIESGQPGDVARGLLLPYYNRSLSGKFNYKDGYSAKDDQDFLTQKKRTKIAINAYYVNKKDSISSFYTIRDFLDKYAPLAASYKDSNIVKVLRHFLTEGTDYSIVCSTKSHVVIWEKTQAAAYACDYYQVTIDEYESYATKWRSNKNALIVWGQTHDIDRRIDGRVNNLWCTGWQSSYFDSYSESSGYHLYAIIQIAGDLNDRDQNFQISINDSGQIKDAENGSNKHEGLETNWRRIVEGIFPKDLDLFQQLYSIRYFSKSDRMQKFAQENNLQATALKINTSDIYADTEPFIYRSPQDVVNFISENGKTAVTSIDTLIIADGVTEIPTFQFENWFGLLEIKFPDSLVRIGDRAFSGCKSLMRIKKFNDGLTTIGRGAFEGCSSLRGSILLPNSIESIGTYAFNGCNVKFRLKTSVKNIPGKKILVPSYPEEERKWWRSNGRITIAD